MKFERSNDGRLKGVEDNNIVSMDLYWKGWVNYKKDARGLSKSPNGY